MRRHSSLLRLRFVALLASASTAALLIGGGRPASADPFDNCATADSGTAASLSNSDPNGTCIEVSATVSGNVTNTNTGTLTGGSSGVSQLGIIIDGGTVGGSIVNSGTITGLAHRGIVLNAGAVVFGDISNSGTITYSTNNIGGIVISGASQLGTASAGGNIVNSGLISVLNGPAISVNNVATVYGGITNSGTISVVQRFPAIGITNVTTFAGGVALASGGTISGQGIAISVSNVVQFGSATPGGGISNAGTIIGTANSPSGTPSIRVAVTTFSGGITNSGTISLDHRAGIDINAQHFDGGINNSGTISETFFPSFGNVAIRFSGGSGGFLDATFAGGATNSGTISAGSSINIGSIKAFLGGFTNSGTISAGVGGGGVVVQGIGSGDFTGGFTNSGTISSAAFILWPVSISDFSSFSGGITNSGTISGASLLGNLDVRNISIFSGGITNSGTISGGRIGINVSNVAQFVSPSTTGGITNTGTISANTGIKVASSAPVSIFDSGTIIDGTAVDLSANAPGNTFTLGPGYSITGAVIGRGSDTFQLGGTGSGAFDLALVGTQYQGFTTFTVVSGTWTASNTDALPQAWTVNGGTLAGTGTLPGLTVNAGGAFAPGNPGTPGMFNITGNLTFNAGANYVITFNGATPSKAIAGTATLDPGAHVVVAAGSTFNPGQTYTILTAAGGVSGTFAPSIATGALFRATLSYDPDDVFVTFAFNQLAPLLPPNAPANVTTVTTAIDNFLLGGGTLPGGFQNLFNITPTQIDNTLTQLSGEAATGAQPSGFRLMTDFMSLLVDPQQQGGASSGGALPYAPADAPATLTPDVAAAYASVLPAPAATFEQRWNMWGSVYGGTAHLSGDAAVGGSHDVSARAGGFAAGADRFVTPDTRFGFALAGGFTGWGLSGGLGTGRGDAFQAGIYGRTAFGPVYFAGALAYTQHWMSTDRFVLGDHLKANFAAESAGARFEAGYRLPVSSVGVIPYAAIQTQRFHTPGYSETDLTGGGFGLTFNAQSSTDTRAELGSRFEKLVPLGADAQLALRSRLAWAHDWVSNPALTATFQALSGASFVVNGAAPRHDAALVSFGPELRWRNGWSLMTKFDGELASGTQVYAGTARLSYAW